MGVIANMGSTGVDVWVVGSLGNYPLPSSHVGDIARICQEQYVPSETDLLVLIQR